MLAKSDLLTLEQFLELPETNPAREFINGEICQKPMPKIRHSRLQAKLIAAINEVTEAPKIAYAFPELRCTFGGRSIVLDIVVLDWSQIQFDEEGEPLDDVLIAPSWSIEILSPLQSSNRVTGNILHSLKYGCLLSWLVDPEDCSIMVFEPQQQPELYQGGKIVPVLENINLDLTAEQIFSWLKMR